MLFVIAVTLGAFLAFAWTFAIADAGKRPVIESLTVAGVLAVIAGAAAAFYVAVSRL